MTALETLPVALSRRACFGVAAAGALTLALPRTAMAGAQLEEPLIDSVRTALSSAINNHAPPVPEFGTTEARLQYLRWLGVTLTGDLGTSIGTGRSVASEVGSAFGNTIISTYPDGLVSFATDPVVNAVIPALFIIGGLGYVVFHDIARHRRWSAWSLNTKIMLLGTDLRDP